VSEKSAETSFPYEFIRGKDVVVPTTLLAVILGAQRPSRFTVVNLNDGNDQDAWKGQPYDTDRGVKQTYSLQNESPTNWPETQMLTETRAIDDAIDISQL
jgi:hypothetical protein